MPDGPTTKSVDFHRWLRWRERAQRGSLFTDPQIASDELFELARAELYELALEDIVEFTGTAQPKGLLDTGPYPYVISRETIERGRFELIDSVERFGAYLVPKKDIVLRPRWSGSVQSGLRSGLGGHLSGLEQYGDLHFRLTKPAQFEEYLAGRWRPRRAVTVAQVATLLIESELFQRHRDEKLMPPASLLIREVRRCFADLAIPRDNVLRRALKDPRVTAVYEPRGVGALLKWERQLMR